MTQEEVAKALGGVPPLEYGFVWRYPAAEGGEYHFLFFGGPEDDSQAELRLSHVVKMNEGAETLDDAPVVLPESQRGQTFAQALEETFKERGGIVKPPRDDAP